MLRLLSTLRFPCLPFSPVPISLKPPFPALIPSSPNPAARLFLLTLVHTSSGLFWCLVVLGFQEALGKLGVSPSWFSCPPLGKASVPRDRPCDLVRAPWPGIML